MHRLAQALCGLCLALGTAAAAPLVLTGLSRIGGETRAFFGDPTTGSYFSLTPGEDGGGVRLLEVQFKDRSALVADRTGTNRIVFGSKDISAPFAPRTTLTHSDGTAASDRPERRMVVTAVNQLPETQPNSETPSSAEGVNPAGLAARADGAVANEAVAASPDSVPAQPTPTRRRATADELFKARNGYSAWEDLLRQRHQADMLAISPTANANP